MPVRSRLVGALMTQLRSLFVFSLALLFPLLFPGAIAQAATYYVAPSGNDSNPGTQSAPWGTVQHAVKKLRPGDTLLLRGGTYWESDISLDGVHGTADAPITIKNYPGERPVIDGGYREFRTIGNNDWEVVDAGRHVYRSTKTYPNSRVWGKFEHEGKLYALGIYKSLASLQSDNIWYSSNSYAGPGIFYNSNDRRIYIRLQPVDPRALNGEKFDLPKNPDPRRNRIFLGSTANGSHGLFVNNGTVRHVVFEGVDLAHHRYTVRFHSAGNTNLTFRNFTAVPMDAFMIIGRGDASNLVIDNIDILLGFPRWIAWREIKTEDAGALGAMKLAGIAADSAGKNNNIVIRNSLFDRAFDALAGFWGDSNIKVLNNDMITYDDAFQLAESASNVEFAYNRIDGPGISHYGPAKNPSPGTVWVHHNIIDARRPVLWERRNSSGSNSVWNPARVLPTHGKTDNGHPWKVYNNTLLGASSSSSGLESVPWNNSGVSHEVYNNIVISGDRWVTRWMRVDRNDIYDGNAYWRTTTDAQALFHQVTNGNSDRNFATLKEFKDSDWWKLTKNYPAEVIAIYDFNDYINNNYSFHIIQSSTITSSSFHWIYCQK
jgi:hypothetical protein